MLTCVFSWDTVLENEFNLNDVLTSAQTVILRDGVCQNLTVVLKRLWWEFLHGKPLIVSVSKQLKVSFSTLWVHKVEKTESRSKIVRKSRKSF